jgi:DNA-binding NarL/FixJ family response regulator
VLLDLHLGGHVGTALPAVRPVIERGAQVLVLSASSETVEIGACLEAGACGFVSKAASFDHLLGAVHRAMSGEDVLPPDEVRSYLGSLRDHRLRQTVVEQPFRRLSRREQHVLHLLCDGLSVQTIALRENVSVATVRTQVKAVLHKLGVGSQLEAVSSAYRSGWHRAQESAMTG